MSSVHLLPLYECVSVGLYYCQGLGSLAAVVAPAPTNPHVDRIQYECRYIIHSSVSSAGLIKEF